MYRREGLDGPSVPDSLLTALDSEYRGGFYLHIDWLVRTAPQKRGGLAHRNGPVNARPTAGIAEIGV